MSDSHHHMSDEELEAALQRLPPPTPSPALWERISARAAQRGADTPAPALTASRRPLRAAWGILAAAAVCCLAIALCLSARRGSAPAPPAQAPRMATRSPTPPTPTPTDRTPTEQRQSAARAESKNAHAPGESLPVPRPAPVGRREPPPTESVEQPPHPTTVAALGPQAPEAPPSRDATPPEASPISPLEEQPDDPAATSSYYAKVSLPDGTESVLVQSIHRNQAGEPRAIHLEYARTPPKAGVPGIGG
jgi:hypothetical protein